MGSLEMKKLLLKYPDTRKGRNDALCSNREKLSELYQNCNRFLDHDASAGEIRKHDLKMVLENHRLEMKLQTADLLQELEFADDVNLKKLYNYNLATNRHAYESMLEAREEFLT